MSKSIRIGGVHHAGGNHEVGSFRQPASSQPKRSMSIVDLTHRAPQKVVVNREAPTPTTNGAYVLWWDHQQLAFATDQEVRRWLADHRFTKKLPPTNNKNRRSNKSSTGVTGTWIQQAPRRVV